MAAKAVGAVELPEDEEVGEAFDVGEAGFELARLMKALMPDVPVVLQTSRTEFRPRALAERYAFLRKRSPTLLQDLRRILTEEFGFGDFVFRLPDLKEVGRAKDLNELEEQLQTVPPESLTYHAQSNHFSHWLMARTEFALAAKLRPRKVSDFASPEHLRRNLIESINDYRREQSELLIGDFNAETFKPSETSFLRIGAGSFVTPVQIYDLDLVTGERTLLREQPVLGDYRREDYVERRDWAYGADGTRIPVSIVHRANIEFPAPALVYGYGAYEICDDPRFSVARLSLLDRGMVFVVAHVRGGGEMGRLWYEHGKLLEKKNTFTDFIAVANHLVDSGLTRPEQLVALGGSAGGLLMGAVANMAPDLFAGILAQVPFVDPLTTILDPSLPLTVTEWDEWGNPLSDSDVYHYMKSYSPYENVAAQKYPAILAMTSLHDTRVYYVEPAKWVAALRHSKTDGNPVLLKTQMTAGHGGISGRYERWKEVAYQYAWLLAAADRDHYGSGQVDDLLSGAQG